ncbi:MAG: SpoIIE family protein phosphatase [Phycisphaerae bacterium]|nr:SpoIIE family protein phosphatase [Phycisphaerae bacterium]
MAPESSDQIRQLSDELRQAREELKRCGELLLTIQKSILPQQLPAVPSLDLAVHFADAGGVGGDFYDVHPIGRDRWAIVIADVAGHGLAAAALLGLVHALGSAVRGREPAPSPGSSLSLVNRLLAQYLGESGQFVTAFVGQYDARTDVLTYASAGHPYPRLIRGDSLLRLDAATAMPLGISAASVYEEASVQLQPGDRLVLFTDGITESPDEAHELFGDERLEAVASATSNTAAELLDRIVNSVRTLRGGSPAIDDETCLVALVKPVPTATPEP